MADMRLCVDDGAGASRERAEEPAAACFSGHMAGALTYNDDGDG